MFFIGEKPREGIPICLMNLASVVEVKISGLASFPPDAKIACLNADHHGLDSSVGVARGRPLLSLIGPFCISYKNMEDKNTSEIEITICNNPLFCKDHFQM